VSGAFAARRRIEGRVLVVDDVFTTGATIIAAATALLAAGAGQVDAVTFARARPPGAALAP
jgi:predicted amidophosphoribosyltransferase